VSVIRGFHRLGIYFGAPVVIAGAIIAGIACYRAWEWREFPHAQSAAPWTSDKAIAPPAANFFDQFDPTPNRLGDLWTASVPGFATIAAGIAIYVAFAGLGWVIAGFRPSRAISNPCDHD
jgi:hypothetical protein